MEIKFKRHAWDALGNSKCSRLIPAALPREIDGDVQVEVSDGIASTLGECLDRENKVLKVEVDSSAASGTNNAALVKQFAGINQAWIDVHAAIGLATREG